MAGVDALRGLLSLEGSVAVVTGGGGGIGCAVVEALLAAGAAVTSVDLPGHEPPDGATHLPCDLAREEDLVRLEHVLRERHPRIDILVHCAGITRDATLAKMTTADWRDVLRTNLESAFWLVRLCAERMRAQRGGKIVLIASINGERGKFGQANYAASKAGLIALGKTAAKELGKHGVRVNVVSPGLIDTAMTSSLPAEVRAKALEESALGRAGHAADVARAVLFFCSELSSHVTGQVLRVDGGQLMA